MFYECEDDQTIRRYLTYIPSTRETEKVANPFIKKLQRPEMLMPAEKEEFEQYWPPDDDDVPNSQEAVSEFIKARDITIGEHFDPDMTIGEAMGVHPKVAEVFAAFHLGGCSSCGVSEYETVGQVCMGYGVDVEVLLEVLESLMADGNETAGENETVEEAATAEGSAS